MVSLLPGHEKYEGAPETYRLRLTIDWKASPNLEAFSNERDKREGWPVIAALADAVSEQLGGEYVDDVEEWGAARRRANGPRGRWPWPALFWPWPGVEPRKRRKIAIG
jgi:hypothetical protein